MKGLLRKIKSSIQEEKSNRQDKYELVSHLDDHNGTGKIYGKVRIVGTRKIFVKPASMLYEKEWIEQFSREDAAFIGVLVLSEQTKDRSVVSLFPRRKRKLTKNVIFLAMAFVSFLVVSNLTAFKLVEFHLGLPKLLDITFPAALIFFPLTYFFDDTITEVYGFKISRIIIWGGLICNTLVTLGLLATVYLPPSHVWHYQKAYSIVYDATARVFIASLVGYFAGEFFNAIILSKLKVLTSGRWLWLRIISSTSIGVGLDSFLFCHIAFSGLIPAAVVWQMIMVQYCFKLGYEILALPLTYLLTGYLKKKDDIDYYDYQTNFNPFSLSIEEPEEDIEDPEEKG